MLVLTTDVLPENLEVVELHGFISFMHSIPLNHKNALQRAFSGRDETREDGMNGLIDVARRYGTANVIFGLRVTATTASFSNGSFMYVTHYATLATVEER